MLDDAEWYQATVAPSAFVHDPAANGLDVALMYSPFGKGTCDPTRSIVVALVADGSPNACDSTSHKVANRRKRRSRRSEAGSVLSVAVGYIAHTDIAKKGDCAVPAGRFACGPLYRAKAGDICGITWDLTAAPSTYSYACVALPAGCSTGCNCGLCVPCPPGAVCHESCYSITGGPALECNIL
jgi:hypothetical protein